VKFRVFFSFFLVWVASGCATYQSKTWKLRQDIRNGQFQQALDKLKPLAEAESKDQLVYLLDYASALQIAGRYKESSEALIKADRLADQMDYHSVSKITAATLGSEEMIQYKGDSYEKILLNSMNSINFLMMNQHDDAMVEVRRVNEKINRYRFEGRKEYELNPFAHYLAGMIWESDQKYDDANIDYEKAYEIGMDNPFLAQDLIRSAKLAKRTEHYEKWKQKFPEIQESPEWYNKKNGELIIIHQQGWGPEKHFSPVNIRYPKLFSVPSETAYAKIKINGAEQVQTQSIYSIEQVAIKTLDDDVGWMIARKIGATAAKAVVADQIRQKNENLGDLAWIIMRLSDRADLRQWSTLPRAIYISRIWLPAGEHEIEIQGYSGVGSPTADRLEPVKIKVSGRQKTFLNWRSFR